MKAKDFSSITARLQRELDARPHTDSNPRAHLQSVQQQIEALGRGDLAGVLAQARPDVRLDIFVPPEFPFIRQAVGVDELRRAIEHNFDSIEDQRPEITKVYAEGDSVVLFGRERGRLRSTGATYHLEFVERFTFEDQRLAAVRIIAAHAADDAESR